MSQLPINLPKITEADITEVRTHITAIKTILAPKFTNLEPADRKKYGSVNKWNKLCTDKVKDYYNNQPGLANPNVDWEAFIVNYDTRTRYLGIISMIGELKELCNDPRTLVDFVLWSQARQDYKWTKYKAEDDGGGTEGFEEKYDTLKEFFKHEGDEPPYVVVDDDEEEDDEDDEDDDSNGHDAPTP